MRFTKMQGVGNDFVVVDASVLAAGTSLPKLAIRTCDRKLGIGADGLLIIRREPGTQSPFQMRMFNPDGSEDMCGNGLRCVSLWAHRAGWLSGRSRFTAATKEGLRAVRLLETDQDSRNGSFGVDMGVPHFEAEDLPFCDPSGGRVIDFPLTVNGETYSITTVNTGSTHTVIFGEQPDEATFQRVSPLIENNPLFPERTSVLWATPTDSRTLKIRIWERGAGETLGCGTGACAVGVAAVINHLSEPNTTLDIVSKGGTLRITWPGVGAPVDMVGPAQIVYDGDFADDFAPSKS